MVLVASNHLLTFLFFFFNDTPPTEIYPLPLHAALPIYPDRTHLFEIAAEDRDFARLLELDEPVRADLGDGRLARREHREAGDVARRSVGEIGHDRDRESTRLNSSHLVISYAVFCL